MTKGISVNELYSKKRKLLQFDGEFAASIGKPEQSGAWIIWGLSGSGKTSFTMQLAKYMTRFGRVAYNSMEEGDSETIKLAFKRVGMEQVKRKIILLDNESIDEMKERLRKHKAPQIVIIDSVQYSGMTYSEYKAMRKEFKNVLFIIISHARGKEPHGNVAEKIRYDAFVKIRVEGYKAFITSRYGGGEPYTIWKEGADKYHADSL